MEQKPAVQKPLWTKDFTIITLGSIVSMIGNALAGFALSLLVLDYTESNFLYAVYIAVYTLPQVIVPFFSGAILDRFSRKKTIYTLDFVSAGLYALLGIILKSGWFNFPVFALFCFIAGSISGIYLVAYESFYPLLISEGNFSKAYSVSSMLETLCLIGVPLSAYLYNSVGIFVLLEVDACFFFVAAVMETQIKAKEAYIEKQASHTTETSRFRQMLSDTKEGLAYLASEKGLLSITIYFIFSYLAGGAMSVILLPYFKSNFSNGEYIYMLVFGMAEFGRAIGGFIHYKFKFPTDKKYLVAFCVYIIISLIDGSFLYFPVIVMMILNLASGILSVTSYTIRISATQSYVPDEKKGRYNGTFNMLTMTGNLAGEIIAGALAARFPSQYVLTGFMLFTAVCAIVIIGGNRKSISAIYNRDL